MTRDELLKEVLGTRSDRLMLELATSVGKSRLAIEKLKQWDAAGKIENILLAVPMNVLKQNWLDELVKWKAEHLIPKITFTTYVSIPKNAGNYSVIVLDEAHRLSERGFAALMATKIDKAIVLSATLTRTIKADYRRLLGDYKLVKVDIRDAIDEEILPEPEVILVPLSLDDVQGEFEYEKKVNGQMVKYKGPAWKIHKMIDDDVSYWNDRTMVTGEAAARNIWLSKCGKRLKMLSSFKMSHPLIEGIRVYAISKGRSISFCADTAQASLICKNDVTSKRKEARTVLEKFNKHLYNHISAVSMLNEGANLSDCRVGIFYYIASSEIISKQRMGRILRHSEPMVFFIYFKGTREEEIIYRQLSNFRDVYKLNLENNRKERLEMKYK